MLYKQAPAGERIILNDSGFDSKLLEDYFSPYHLNFYDSGTSALAAAVTASIKIKDIKTPEVLIPAYGCPDLVSAIVYAGAKPVFIDLLQDRPWMDTHDLKINITRNTTAIIAVNFLGIPEQLTQLSSIALENNVFLIEDNAQSFPIKNTPSEFTGDLAILSFGRGKPVNLLTGGAVLYRDADIKTVLYDSGKNPNHKLKGRISYDIKVKLFNFTISPYIYGFIDALPFLHLGETRYRKLNRIGKINNRSLECLHENIRVYLARETKTQEIYSQLISTCSKEKLINLPATCCNNKVPRLLRYPILIHERKLRDKIYQALKHAGIGVSKMYPDIIPEICGLTQNTGNHRYQNAVEFSGKILTLPTHERITENDIEKTRTILSNFI